MNELTYTWYPGVEPSDIPARNVAVFAFDSVGRVALWLHDGRYGLPGGRIEPDDADWDATARREVREEINADLHDVRFLGHQTVHDNVGSEVWAQVRMIARFGTVGRARPDPDACVTRERIAVPPALVMDLLGWADDRAHQQMADAADAAHRLWSIRAAPNLACAPIWPTSGAIGAPQ